MNTGLIHKLQQALKEELPGMSAHLQYSPGKFREEYYQPAKDCKQAAVMAIIFNKLSTPHLIFIKRSTFYKSDKHAGQISFPGGQIINEKESLITCAFRETEEEIGLKESELEVIGELSPIYVFVSNYLVQPFLTIHKGTPDYFIDSTEVDIVLEAPLDSLIHEGQFTKKDIVIRNTILKDVPYFDVSGETLWGATAMMTNEILTILKGL